MFIEKQQPRQLNGKMCIQHYTVSYDDNKHLLQSYLAKKAYSIKINFPLCLQIQAKNIEP